VVFPKPVIVTKGFEARLGANPGPGEDEYSHGLICFPVQRSHLRPRP
jgi:hypothetical protein